MARKFWCLVLVAVAMVACGSEAEKQLEAGDQAAVAGLERGAASVSPSHSHPPPPTPVTPLVRGVTPTTAQAWDQLIGHAKTWDQFARLRNTCNQALVEENSASAGIYLQEQIIILAAHIKDLEDRNERLEKAVPKTKKVVNKKR